MKTTLTLLFLLFSLFLRGQDSPFKYPTLPDTAFDIRIFYLPDALVAEQRFRLQLDTLLLQPQPDTIAIARTWRRIAVARLCNPASGFEAQPFIHKSVKLLWNKKPLPEEELAKSLLVYANSLMSIGNYDSVFWAAELATDMNRRLHGEGSEAVGLSYGKLAIACGNTTRYTEGLQYAEKAVEVLAKIWSGPHPYFADALFTRGWMHMELGNFEQSLKDYAETEAITRQTLGAEHSFMGEIYHFAGVSHQSLGDYDSALDYYKRSLAMREKLWGLGHPHTRYPLTFLSNFCLATGDYAEAVRYREKSYDIRSELERDFQVLRDSSLWGDLSNFKFPTMLSVYFVRLYAVVGDYEMEARTFEYVLAYAKKFQEENIRIASAYGYHALALANQGRWPEALGWAEQAIDLIHKLNPKEPQIANEFWQQKGEILTAMGHFDEAEAAFAEVLQHPRNIGDELKAWKGKADMYLKKARRGRQPDGLKTAIKNYMIAIEKLDALRLSAWSPASRMEQSRLNFSLFEGALAASALQNDRETAFWLAEKSKAQSVLENLRDDTARRATGLPDSLLRLERTLKKEVTTFEQKAFEALPGPQRQAAEESLFDKKQALGVLVKSFETEYPEYFRLKYNTQLADAAKIQNRLLDDTIALIEYFVGDSTIFIFTLTKNELQLTQLPMPQDLENTIEDLRKSLTDSELRITEEDVPLFSETAAKLYGWLLEKPLEALPKQTKKLILVPDGMLGYVPFEILGKTEAPTDFKTFPYLFRNFNVSYAASANLLLEQSERFDEADPTELFAGFAPSYSAGDTSGQLPSNRRRELVRDEKYELPGAAKEVQEISGLLNGKAFLATDATEHNFKENAARFRILHLAMHSILDDQNPMFTKLLFTKTVQDSLEDNDLNANELYNFRLPATSLVVLSACNTGAGKLRRGEGIMSLSRAFTYSGVPATVMSLWQAPDETTRQVMVAFYKNLKTGMRKDEALRQAKLTYLSGCKDGTLASPFYWAGFVAGGEMGALFSGK